MGGESQSRKTTTGPDFLSPCLWGTGTSLSLGIAWWAWKEWGSHRALGSLCDQLGCPTYSKS